MKKKEKLNNLIFNGFGDKKNYDEIKYGLNRARLLMLHHNVFDKAPVGSQYEMCMTIYIIATQSGTKKLHNFRILSRPEEKVFEYALDEGFVPLKNIDSEEPKLLK